MRLRLGPLADGKKKGKKKTVRRALTLDGGKEKEKRGGSEKAG